MSDIPSIKQKSIIAYLSSLGFEPKKNGIKTAMYLCPWRGEHEPSLAVYKNTNTFCDWGTKEGGSIIELVQKLHDVDFVGALRILENGNVSSVTQQSVMPRKDEPPPIKIISIGEITSDFIIRYLQKRCISLSVAQRYCKQARVELRDKDDKPYRKTLIAFPNLKGGFEFRNKFSKISNSPKYYSELHKGHSKCIMFEGFFDVLSFIEIYGEPPMYTIICLNSASFVDYVDWKRFDSVAFLGHNDSTGQHTFDVIQALTPTKDMRHLYKAYKDLNAYLVNMMEFKNEFLNKKLL